MCSFVKKTNIYVFYSEHKRTTFNEKEREQKSTYINLAPPAYVKLFEVPDIIVDRLAYNYFVDCIR